MTIDLTSIANAVIALIAAIITAFVIPWIRSKTTAAQFEKIKMWVTVAVEAAEQLYTGSGRGAEKKAYVVEFLNSNARRKSTIGRPSDIGKAIAYAGRSGRRKPCSFFRSA